MADAAASERRKWAIVGILAMVLAGIAWSQFGSDAGGPGETAATRQKRPEIAPPTAKPAPRAWPRCELADVIRHNPFAPLLDREAATMAPVEPQADPAESAENALATFRSRRVRAVFFTEEGPAALLDTTLVHEGDVIDGVRITSIGPDGVVVEPAAAGDPEVRARP